MMTDKGIPCMKMFLRHDHPWMRAFSYQ